MDLPWIISRKLEFTWCRREDSIYSNEIPLPDPTKQRLVVTRGGASKAGVRMRARMFWGRPHDAPCCLSPEVLRGTDALALNVDFSALEVVNRCSNLVIKWNFAKILGCFSFGKKRFPWARDFNYAAPANRVVFGHIKEWRSQIVVSQILGEINLIRIVLEGMECIHTVEGWILGYE